MQMLGPLLLRGVRPSCPSCNPRRAVRPPSQGVRAQRVPACEAPCSCRRSLNVVSSSPLLWWIGGGGAEREPGSDSTLCCPPHALAGGPAGSRDRPVGSNDTRRCREGPPDPLPPSSTLLVVLPLSTRMGGGDSPLELPLLLVYDRVWAAAWHRGLQGGQGGKGRRRAPPGASMPKSLTWLHRPRGCSRALRPPTPAHGAPCASGAAAGSPAWAPSSGGGG